MKKWVLLGFFFFFGACVLISEASGIELVGAGATFPHPLYNKMFEVYSRQSGGGIETIFLVEDEPAVRTLAARILRNQGYHVVEAKDGSDALHLLEKDGIGRIDLLLTDVVMPHMSGRELADKLVALQPQIKTLYTSGYTDDAIVHHGVLEEGTAFLQKPFSPASLIQKVRIVLDS